MYTIWKIKESFDILNTKDTQAAGNVSSRTRQMGIPW